MEQKANPLSEVCECAYEVIARSTIHFGRRVNIFNELAFEKGILYAISGEPSFKATLWSPKFFQTTLLDSFALVSNLKSRQVG